MKDTLYDKIMVTRSSMPPFDEYVEMIKPLWETRMLTNMGKYHQHLETSLKEYLGVEYVSLTANGHLALEMAIQSMKFPEGSEVITTPFTFVSTTHAIMRNHLKPVFCDIQDDYTIDVTKIEELITEKTVAIVPVHVYGNICNVEEIERIAYKHGLKVIYDAAHAFGERYNDKGVGEFGDMSIFSFHATKVFHTIEGGAVCCHLKEQYEHLYNLKNFGIRSEELVVSIGGNAKMNEFQAAMGLLNLKYLEAEIERRKHAVELYWTLLGNLSNVRLNKYKVGIKPNYSYLPILFESLEQRNKVYLNLAENNIFSRKYFYPIVSDQVCFNNQYCGLKLDYAKYCADRILVLPLYADIKDYEIETIVDIVKANI